MNQKSDSLPSSKDYVRGIILTSLTTLGSLIAIYLSIIGLGLLQHSLGFIWGLVLNSVFLLVPLLLILIWVVIGTLILQKYKWRYAFFVHVCTFVITLCIYLLIRYIRFSYPLPGWVSILITIGIYPTLLFFSGKYLRRIVFLYISLLLTVLIVFGTYLSIQDANTRLLYKTTVSSVWLPKNAPLAYAPLRIESAYQSYEGPYLSFTSQALHFIERTVPQAKSSQPYCPDDVKSKIVENRESKCQYIGTTKQGIKVYRNGEGLYAIFGSTLVVIYGESLSLEEKMKYLDFFEEVPFSKVDSLLAENKKLLYQAAVSWKDRIKVTPFLVKPLPKGWSLVRKHVDLDVLENPVVIIEYEYRIKDSDNTITSYPFTVTLSSPSKEGKYASSCASCTSVPGKPYVIDNFQMLHQQIGNTHVTVFGDRPLAETAITLLKPVPIEEVSDAEIDGYLIQ